MPRKQCAKCGGAQAVRPGSLCNKCFAGPKTQRYRIALDSIRLDGGTQSREGLSQDVIAEYAEAMANGDEFPAAVVFDDGSNSWLASGFHRYHASQLAGRDYLDCDVRSGTQADAVLHAAGENAAHGLRRTAGDKRRAVAMLLESPVWQSKSSAWIAQACKVSWGLVDVVRKQIAPDVAAETPREGQDGKTYQMPVRDETLADDGEADESEQEDGGSALAAEPTPKDDRPRDLAGRLIPPQAASALAAGEQFREAINHLRLAFRKAKAVVKTSGGERLAGEFHEFAAHMTNAIQMLKFSQPYAVCCYCSGLRDRCNACHGAGWVSAGVFAAAPLEQRKGVAISLDEEGE